MLLKNKVILVTGSTTGIGEAIGRHCIAEGATVMFHGRDEDRAKSLVNELGNANCAYVISDMEEEEHCNNLVQATIDEFGTIDCLVNNAALTTRSHLSHLTNLLSAPDPIPDSDAKLFNKIMAVNLRAPLLLSRAAVAHFRDKKKPGNIINIGSMNAYCGQTDLLIYSMSKGGLMTMTRNLGDALGPEKIRVNQLNVGWTVTANEIALKQKEGLPNDWMRKVDPLLAPSGQLLAPDNIANHVVFWLSDSSAPVTGCVYDVEQYPVIGRNLIPNIWNLTYGKE